MNIVALLPMKGHSERVKNKNLKLFAEKPLFSYVLSSLVNSKYISKVIVNTDSEEIAEAVSQFKKVIVHNRPEEICGDFVSMNEIINYDISQSKEEVFLQTHSTNPLLKTSTIDAAIELFEKNQKEYDSLFSVTKIQTRLYDQSGQPVNHNPNELIRTQDLPPLFEENSNIFIFSKKSFENADKKRIGLKPLMFEMDASEAVDIDTPEDFKLAEALYQIKKA